MSSLIPKGVADALQLIGAGRIGEATALLRDRGAPPPSPRRQPGRIDLGSLQAHLPKGLHGLFGRGARPEAETTADGARFVERTFTNAFGTRAYKLYIPASAADRPLPLVVMLHGCTQDPDDFAAGTRMNALAEEHGLLVAYPAQPSSANPSKCWNWFDPAHQRTEAGEPSLIAGIARQVMRDHRVEPTRVYVAGLSAGGAAALNTAILYPDLFAAAGVHSGLPYRAAHDMASAFSAMRQGPAAGAGAAATSRPAIVFHGSQDGTVHPRNAAMIIQQLQDGRRLKPDTELGETGGHSYTRTTYTDARGDVVLEQWSVQGAGHAWFGGSSAGSYTDTAGPDASREMVRFFLAHPSR